MRHLLGAVSFLALILVSSSAFALDAYQDRRGIFLGMGLGGGIGAASTDLSGESTGLDTGRQIGLDLSATVGGGVTESLTIGAQGNWWVRTVKFGERSLEHQHLNLLANANLFILSGLYVEAGAGLAYAAFDTARGDIETFTYRELGLAARGGAGFEFFLNGTTALGVNAGYTRHFYNNAEFDTLSVGFTVRWY
jgi:hypothetical protein